MKIKGGNFMEGLDQAIVDSLNPSLALGRIETDNNRDLIYAPHINIVYQFAKDELWNELKRQLKSGVFGPSLPIYMNIPKSSGLTRPSSIQLPLDRLIYQILIDYIAPTIESNLNRSVVFSNRLLNPDKNFEMFEDSGDSYGKFTKALEENCSKFDYAIKTDVASYFESIHHHPLITSLRSIGCSPEVVNLLESLISLWREIKSYGILQQNFASDVLGNFYLFDIDYQLQIMGISSVRYVDDIYIFLHNKNEALKTLGYLSDIMRRNGLFLNEAKTYIKTTNELIQEETEADKMINEIRSEIKEKSIILPPYGFGISWHFNIPWYEENEEELPEEKEYDKDMIEELYSKRYEAKWQSERIIKFCLPLLARFKSEIAIDESIENIIKEPHLARLYCGYLVTFIKNNPTIAKKLFSFLINENPIYEWQYMWIYATLLYQKKMPSDVLDIIMKQFLKRETTDALRAICSILMGYKGDAAQKRILRSQYQYESSEYVKAAILYSASFFPTDERRACYKAWGSHSTLNTLIVSALINARKAQNPKNL